MIRRAWLVSILLLLCLGSSFAKNSVQQKRQEIVSAWGSKDLDTIMSLYADDAVLVIPGGTRLTGKAQIKDHWANLIARRDPVEFGLASHAAVIDDDVLSDTGLYSYVSNRQGGRYFGQYLIVWKKVHGQFVIVQEMYSRGRNVASE